MEYEVIIGLEVHAQLLTKTKIFCGCSTAFGANPNTHTCPVCLGMPGTLPVLNKKAVELAIMMALATGCRIAPLNRFARKNYFYPDLPKGYQISQYEMPLAENGCIEIEANDTVKRIGVTRIHLEEDAAKALHEPDRTLLDFNRCGIPLIEIVSEPDIRTIDEAVAYLKKLRTILRYLGICDGKMEKGRLRCDANLSLRPKGESALRIRTELKNMNSFRAIHRALEYEIERQSAVLEPGGQVDQETRLWNEIEGKTSPMRSKEESCDYRYFPEPDLLPVAIDSEWVERIKRVLPELPDQKKDRFIREYSLSAYDAGILTDTRDLADYFESCSKEAGDPKMAANWTINTLLRGLKRDDRDIRHCPVSPGNLASLIRLIRNSTISGKMAKEIFDEMSEAGSDAEKIVRAKGGQISDEGEIARAVNEVIKDNPKQVSQYCAGKIKLLDFFIGQVMKKTRAKANPQTAKRLLKRSLSKRNWKGAN